MGSSTAPGLFGRWAPSAAVLTAFAAVVALAWITTIATAGSLWTTLMDQLQAAQPVERLWFLALVGVMMGAMMLPSALPMLQVYRGLATLDSDRKEGWLRAGVFSGAYLGLWLMFTALALVVLVAVGAMTALSGLGLLVPGALLIAAGAYQFTSWKRTCLANCRTPVGFILQHWRKGRSGAARMGLAHGAYCLGCCWVLMLVVFVTGAMSLLWMAGFSAVILAEKVWSRGELFARLIGAAALVGGTAAVAVTAGAFLAP